MLASETLSISSHKVSRWFFATLLLWFVCLAIVCLRVYLHPGLHSVFTIYRAAGDAWIHQADIYSRTAGTFLYSPLIAAFYSPFALISQNLSEVLWRLLLGLALPLALWFNARKLFDFSEKQFACLFFLILPLTLSDLNNGQANIIITVLFLVGVGAAAQSRWSACAFCACLAVYWKIYPIAFALLLAILFPKNLTVRMVLTLVGVFVASLLLQKPSYVLREYASWLASLASDRRRTLEYYGRWRDFYLLLRLLGIPISTIWWTIVQATAGIIAAGICLLGTIRRWPPVTLLFGAMSLAIVWMLLFGPATEAATYELIAVPAAYLLIFSWSDAYHPALRVTSTITYLGFVGADMLKSWFHIEGNVYLVHAIQPCFALCFCAALFFWWRQQLFIKGETALGFQTAD
jgi:glycosyl transferase family 87